MAAGKFIAFITGRFTALTVCGVITHSPRSTGWPSLREVAPVLEQLRALLVAEGVAADDVAGPE